MSPQMPLSILDIPQEILQNIALCSILGCSLGRPPIELYNCLLTCRAFNNALSPKNAGELYFLIFAQQFDIRGPIYRLGEPVVREHAPHEIQRRFRAIEVFRSRSLYHPDLTEALWIAYLMVEDSDTSQKNIKQLLRAQLPSYLDRYLEERLYEGADKNDGWPVITEQISLAIALSWTLASNRVLSYEEPEVCTQRNRRLRPIVFAAFRYSIFHTPEAWFTYSGTTPDTLSASSTQSDHGQYPPSIIPPQNIYYFGTVKRQARPPCAAIFASLLFFARSHRLLMPTAIPSHITFATRDEAVQVGYDGLTMEDVKHFYERCGTRFADFPGFDVGVHSSALVTSPDTILCQPSLYQVGRLTGQWQGSCMRPEHHGPSRPPSSIPVYITLEEHFCYEEASAVPQDYPEFGTANAWLPSNLQAKETKSGMHFFDAKGSIDTTYETYRLGETKLRSGRRIADVIITGKTEARYLAAWGGPPNIIGRVRLHDGLMVLVRYGNESPERHVMRGYVTSSRNLVGRLATSPVGDPENEPVFSLSMDHAQSPGRPSHMMLS